MVKFDITLVYIPTYTQCVCIHSMPGDVLHTSLGLGDTEIFYSRYLQEDGYAIIENIA